MIKWMNEQMDKSTNKQRNQTQMKEQTNKQTKNWKQKSNKSEEKLWRSKMTRFEIAAPNRSWFIYAYVISRVDKNKYRIKWTNLNLVEILGLGVSYQK